MNNTNSESSRILILTNTLRAGGTEKQSIYLAEKLNDRYQVKLIVYYGDQCDPIMLSMVKSTIMIIALKGSHIKKLIDLYKIFKQSKDSIIISYLATTNIINGVLGLLSGIKRRVGGIRSSRIGFIKQRIQKINHNYLLTCSVFNNYAGYEKLTKKGYIISKCIVIPNCIIIKNPPIIRKVSTQFIILSVGRFVKIKDYITTINSVHQAILENKSSKNIKYILVGYGDQEAIYRKYYYKLKIEEHIEIVNNPSELDYFYKNADVFISTSLCEGLSNSIMEAMEYSLPVIATDVGDNHMLIKSNYNGYLLPIKSPIEISKKLLFLLYDDEKRIKMGLNGYEYLIQNYSCSKYKERYIELIQNILCNPTSNIL